MPAAGLYSSDVVAIKTRAFICWETGKLEQQIWRIRLEYQERTLEYEVQDIKTQFYGLGHVEIIWVWELQRAGTLIALLLEGRCSELSLRMCGAQGSVRGLRGQDDSQGGSGHKAVAWLPSHDGWTPFPFQSTGRRPKAKLLQIDSGAGRDGGEQKPPHHFLLCTRLCFDLDWGEVLALDRSGCGRETAGVGVWTH